MELNRQGGTPQHPDLHDSQTIFESSDRSVQLSLRPEQGNSELGRGELRAIVGENGAVLALR